MKKKILILGSSGCLGTSLEDVFKNDKRYIYKGLNHRDVDITQKQKLEKIILKFKPDILINTVALIGINYCEQNPEKTLKVNALSVFEISNICKKLNIFFVQISTHAVFDGELKRLYKETDKPFPINIYGYAKLLGEYFVKNNLDKYLILRMPTMYGPRKNKSQGFVDKMIINMKKNKDLSIASDRMDSPSYAYTISLKIKKLLLKKKKGLFHISDSGRISYHDFIVELAKQIGFKGKIKKAKSASFPALAPNPLRVPMSRAKGGGTGFDWKKSLKLYIKKEKISCQN